MKFLSDRIALIFYRALVRYNLTDTQRKQIQLNKILKTQVEPVLLPYKSSVRLAVQECFTAIFMLTVVSPEYLHYLPTLLFGSLPQSQYKRHFQTFNCALKNARFHPFIVTPSVSPFSPFAAYTICQLSLFIWDPILLQLLGSDSYFCITLCDTPHNLFFKQQIF